MSLIPFPSPFVIIGQIMLKHLKRNKKITQGHENVDNSKE